MKKTLLKLDNIFWKLRYGLYVKFFGVPPRPMIQQMVEWNNIVGVEIGVYRGEHAKSILNALNMKLLYLVDPFNNYEKYTDDYGPESKLDDVFTYTQQRLKRFTGKIKYIRKFSKKAVYDIPDNLDFVYIDGNHAYDFIKEDIELYWPKIKNGGIIGGHDIRNGDCSEHDGIITVVSEFALEHGLQIYINEPDWWFVKNEGSGC